MLGGAVILGATAALLASTGVGLAALPFLADGMEALAAGGISMEASAIANALTSNRGMNISTRSPASARQIIYGQQRVGGVEIYRSTTGSSHDQYNYVIVLAGHECDSIVNLYLDGRQVHWVVGSPGNTTRNGINFGGHCDQGSYVGPNGQQYSFGGGHGGYHVYCESRYGDQLPGDVISALTSNDPIWAATASGSPYVGGCTYVYLKIEYDTNVFPGEPEIRFTVNGKNNIFDPRTGTRGFTSNWALCCADVLTDSIYGLGDLFVNQEQLIGAANVCDEQVACAAGLEARYTTNYHTDTTASPSNLLSTMMDGAAGRLSYIGGEWYLFPAYWQGPSFTFDDNSLTGQIEWTPYRSFSDLFNRVNGTYIAPTYPYNVAGNLYDANGYYNGQTQNNFPFAWQPTNYPQYACDVLHGYAADQFLIEDTPSLGVWDSSGQTTYTIADIVTVGTEFFQCTVSNNSTVAPAQNASQWRVYAGQQLPKELSFSTVISVSQAQRVAKINLMRNRQQGSGTFPMSLAAWQMQPCDVMQFTFPAMGWTEKSLEITGVSFSVSQASGDNAQSVRCTMTVHETDPSVYVWNPSEELTVYDVPAMAVQTSLIPSPPTSMSLTSGASTALIALDGTVQPRIEVQWSTPLDARVTQIQVQYASVSNPTLWLDAGLVDVANNLCFISGVVAGDAYNVRIRSIRASGAVSPWEEIDGYQVSITLSVQGILALAPGSLVSDSFSDGTSEIITQPFTAIVGNASVAVSPTVSTSTSTPVAPTILSNFEADTDWIQAGNTGNSAGNNATGTWSLTNGEPATFSCVSTNGAYADSYWYRSLGSSYDAITEFTYSLQFQFPTAADLTSCQAVEFELQQNVGSAIYNMAWQMPTKESPNYWNYFHYTGDSSAAWLSSGIPVDLSLCQPGEWVSIVAVFHRDPVQLTMTHVSLSINGTVHPVGITQASFAKAESDYLHAAFQIDTTSNTGTAAAFNVKTQNMGVSMSPPSSGSTTGTSNALTVSTTLAGVTTSLAQQTLYFVYYIDQNFTGGNVLPIATTNSSDFLNKPGYFLIDSIVTPYAAAAASGGSGGSGGGGSATGARYMPTGYSDTGSRTTSNPASAYDGNLSTSAVVSGSSTWVASTQQASQASYPNQPVNGNGQSRLTFGSCLWSFPSYPTTTATTLSVVASLTSFGAATGSIVGYIGNTAVTMLSSTTSVASATYTMPIPSGTDISTVSVQVMLIPQDATSESSSSGSIAIAESYIQ